MKIKQINVAMALVAAMALACSCSSKHEEQLAIQPGQLWQNGEALYQVEDSGAVWNLYGGNLHEGGWELKLSKSHADWELRSIAGKHAIVMKKDGKATDVLWLVDGTSCTSRDSIFTHVTTALDSAQAHGISALIEGAYKDRDGKTWRFAPGTLTTGKNTQPWRIGKSLEMYDRVLLIGNSSAPTAMAYCFSAPAQLKLVPAQYVDDPGAYVYFFDDAKANVLKSMRNNRFGDILSRQLMSQFWIRNMICSFTPAQRKSFLNTLKAKSGNNAILKTNIEILEATIVSIEQDEAQSAK